MNYSYLHKVSRPGHLTEWGRFLLDEINNFHEVPIPASLAAVLCRLLDEDPSAVPDDDLMDWKNGIIVDASHRLQIGFDNVHSLLGRLPEDRCDTLVEIFQSLNRLRFRLMSQLDLSHEWKKLLLTFLYRWFIIDTGRCDEDGSRYIIPTSGGLR